MKNRPPPQINDIYKSKLKEQYVIIAGHRGGKWLCKTLTIKKGVFGDSHRMSEYTLKKRYTLFLGRENEIYNK